MATRTILYIGVPVSDVPASNLLEIHAFITTVDGYRMPDKIYNVEEQALYDAATARGVTSWENQDAVTVLDAQFPMAVSA